MATAVLEFDPLNFYEFTPSPLNYSSPQFDAISEGKTKNFVCTEPDCGKVFRFRSELQRHAAAHLTHKPYKCVFLDCNKEFKRRNGLEDHIRSEHTGEASLVCPYPGCELRFATEAKMRYHVVSHLEEKPHKCGYPGCGKSFKTTSQRKQHERSSIHQKTNSRKGSEEQEKKTPKSRVEAHLERTAVVEELGIAQSPVNKKVKTNANCEDLMTQNKLPTVTAPKKKETGCHLIQQILIQNELLRQRLESSEQTLLMMKNQINTISNKMTECESEPLPFIGSENVLESSQETKFVNIESEKLDLRHDPLIEDMRSLGKEEKFEISDDMLKGMIDKEDYEDFFPEFSLEDFGFSAVNNTVKF